MRRATPKRSPSSRARATKGDPIFDEWLTSRVSTVGKKHRKILLTEADGVRETILDQLRDVVRTHYVSPETMAKRLAELGAPATAALLREEIPASKRARSADMGEILATECVVRKFEFDVPIRRLQWKDGREMALRGDDVIALSGDGQEHKLRLLKGEAKSRASLSGSVVEEAAEALNRDKGRPSRHSVLFVAKRLRERGEDAAAALLEKAVLDGFRGVDIEHLLFTLSGNDPETHLSAYIEKHKRRKVRRHAVGLRIQDHGRFIQVVYEGL